MIAEWYTEIISLLLGTGLIGAICDFCEAWVCHSRKCITTHGCPCPLADVLCVECSRDVYSVGGRFYRCCRCAKWLCEDDQMLHQAQCLTMESESLACISCSRAGRWTCTVCKLLFCDTHMVGVRTVVSCIYSSYIMLVKMKVPTTLVIITLRIIAIILILCFSNSCIDWSWKERWLSM